MKSKVANVHVKVRKNEDVNRAIKRFKRAVEASGIMRDIKRKRHYRKPSEAKKIKRAEALKRKRKLEKRKKMQHRKNKK